MRPRSRYNPWEVAPVLLTWLVCVRLVPRWAVPLSFVAAAVVVGIHVAITGGGVAAADLVPRIELTAPTLTGGAVVGLALPPFLVPMASQNVPGVAVLPLGRASCGEREW